MFTNKHGVPTVGVIHFGKNSATPLGLESPVFETWPGGAARDARKLIREK